MPQEFDKNGMIDALQNHDGGGQPGVHNATPSVTDARATQRKVMGSARTISPPEQTSKDAGLSVASKLGGAFNAFNPVANLNKASRALKGDY